MRELSKKEIRVVNGAELSAIDLTIYYWAYEGCKFIVSTVANPRHVGPNPHPTLTMVGNYVCFMGAKYFGDSTRHWFTANSTPSNSTTTHKNDL